MKHQHWIKAVAVAAIAGAAVLQSTVLWAAGPAIGMVKTLEGQAHAVRDGQSVNLAPGKAVQLDDTLITEGGSAIGITLKDSTTLSLGENSELLLDDFLFDPAKDEVSLGLDLAKGIMGYVSGTIAKLDPEAVNVKTPVATIGIRGTRFVVKATPE